MNATSGGRFKVARQVSGVSSTYRKWAEWSLGDVFVGKYLATKIDAYGKNNYTFQVEEAFFKDKKLAASLIGKNLTLNANGMLDKAMEQVEFGTFVQIEYGGTAKIEKGKFAGKEAHSVLVSVVTEGEEGSEEDSDDLI